MVPPASDPDRAGTARPNTPSDDVRATSDWPIPRGVPALLFGGSFDPPHRAHVAVSVHARDQLMGDRGWLIIVPAARSPHKSQGPSASDQDRLDMLCAAFDGVPRVAVWTTELDRARAATSSDAPSYWVDTLELAAHEHSGALDPPDHSALQLRFLIGSDQALAFGRWHRCTRILELADPAVVLRAPAETRSAFARRIGEAGQDQTLLSPSAWLDRVVDCPVLPESSTDVRELLRSGRADLASQHLDHRVLEIIKARGLYAPCAD